MVLFFRSDMVDAWVWFISFISPITLVPHVNRYYITVEKFGNVDVSFAMLATLGSALLMAWFHCWFGDSW